MTIKENGVVVVEIWKVTI